METWVYPSGSFGCSPFGRMNEGRPDGSGWLTAVCVAATVVGIELDEVAWSGSVRVVTEDVVSTDAMSSEVAADRKVNCDGSVAENVDVSDVVEEARDDSSVVLDIPDEMVELGAVGKAIEALELKVEEA
jgi:hypothetical protein